MSWQDLVRIIGSFVAFGEMGEVTRYQMITYQYFALNSDEARAAFLETEDGQWLRDMWNQKYTEPTTTALHPAAFPFPEGTTPTPDEMRKRWLMDNPPETRQLFFDGWEEAKVAGQYWDAEIDKVRTQEERDHLYLLRRTWFAQFYHQRPYLWEYAGMGMTPEQFAEFRGGLGLDEKRQTFFSMYDWDLKPTDAKEAKQWEKDRIAWLEANPDLKASFEEVKDSYDASVKAQNERWDRSIRLSEAADRIKEAAYQRDDKKTVGLVKDFQKIIADGFNTEAFGYDADAEKWKTRGDSLTLRLRKAAGDPAAIKAALYAQRMEAVGRKAGNDPLKWHKIMDRNRDLRGLYFEHNPDKAATWKQDGKYLEFWGRMSRLADRGRWDQYWDSWDAAPDWVKEKFKANSPKKFNEFMRSSRYSDFMGRWVSLFDTKGAGAAMDYFFSLPGWVRERYYDNHPGKRFSEYGGRGSVYVSNLNTMFDMIDAGNWDGAERYWNSMPAWMRRRYYANNPNSTLFRGKRGSGGYSGSGGGLSDTKYKSYVRMMKKWVDLLRDGKEKEAGKYFRTLPKWAQDFYLKRHPDKALMKEDDKMLRMLQVYMGADKAAQKSMLENNPKLARWLQENDSKAAWQNAVQFVYSKLPKDPWLRRVFREKYPEIFGKEAAGKRARRDVADTLADHPEMRGPWEKWYEHIHMTLQEALKWMHARPKSLEIDHSYQRQAVGHTGMSAEQTSESIRQYTERMPQLNTRLPRLETRT
jgi:hypothetical protein